MGIINKLTRNCVFCHVKGGAKYVPAYGIYGEVCAGNWYHVKCLKDVACSPENYPMRMVDLGIDIIDRIKEEKKREDRQKERVKERCEYIRGYCV